MKREKYWEVYRKQPLESSKKDEIFSRISRSLEISQTPRLYKRRMHYVRPVASVVGVSLLCVAVFIVGFIADNQTIKQPSPMVIKPMESGSTVVQASPVGRIIKTQGVLGLQVDGVIQPIEEISEGAIVVLEQGATIVFAIDEKIKTTISGPARFMIEYKNDGTVLLNIIEGKYAQIQSIQSKNDTIPAKGEQTNREVVVKTPLLEVTTRNSKTIDIIIDETVEDQAVVTNAGDEIIVRNLQTQERLSVSQDNEAIRDLNTMIASVGETQVSSLEAEPQLLAIRYETTQEQAKTLQEVNNRDDGLFLSDENQDNQIGVDEKELKALIQDSDDQVIQENDLSEDQLETTTSLSEGRVLDQERMDLLQGLLSPVSVGVLLEKYTESNEEEQAEAINELVGIVNDSLHVLNSSGPTTASTSNLQLLTKKLIGILEGDYFIPPSLISPLYTILETI